MSGRHRRTLSEAWGQTHIDASDVEFSGESQHLAGSRASIRGQDSPVPARVICSLDEGR